MCSSLSSVLDAVPPSLLRRCSALPHTVALHVVALLIAEVVVAPILIGSHRGCGVASFLVRRCTRSPSSVRPTAHRCPVAPLRRSTRWHCHTSHLPEVSETAEFLETGDRFSPGGGPLLKGDRLSKGAHAPL